MMIVVMILSPNKYQSCKLKSNLKWISQIINVLIQLIITIVTAKKSKMYIYQCLLNL